MSAKNSELSRRNFLKRLWIVLGALTLVEVIAVVVAWFKPRPQPAHANTEDALVTAGSVDRFEPGTVSAFTQGKFYLVRLEDGGFMALSRRCTHLSCTVPWVESENQFMCPCHSSAFDIRGEVINPPAPRALDLHPVAIENRVVRVDTSRLFKRSAFSTDQVVYADSA